VNSASDLAPPRERFIIASARKVRTLGMRSMA
jgi:hypothetical protein